MLTILQSKYHHWVILIIRPNYGNIHILFLYLFWDFTSYFIMLQRLVHFGFAGWVTLAVPVPPVPVLVAFFGSCGFLFVVTAGFTPAGLSWTLGPGDEATGFSSFMEAIPRYSEWNSLQDLPLPLPTIYRAVVKKEGVITWSMNEESGFLGRISPLGIRCSCLLIGIIEQAKRFCSVVEWKVAWNNGGAEIIETSCTGTRESFLFLFGFHCFEYIFQEDKLK